MGVDRVAPEELSSQVTVPKDIERGVGLERHAALGWLIGHMGQEGANISTDT